MKEKSNLYMFKGEGAETASAFNVRQAKDIPEPGGGKIELSVCRNAVRWLRWAG